MNKLSINKSNNVYYIYYQATCILYNIKYCYVVVYISVQNTANKIIYDSSNKIITITTTTTTTTGKNTKTIIVMQITPATIPIITNKYYNNVNYETNEKTVRKLTC